MSTKKISYQEAYAELESILNKLENNELDVDQLTDQVKKASELIKICKSRLFETEAEIEKIIEDIDSDESK
jgi:exodeoxyribonuclease VII small subunit